MRALYHVTRTKMRKGIAPFSGNINPESSKRYVCGCCIVQYCFVLASLLFTWTITTGTGPSRCHMTSPGGSERRERWPSRVTLPLLNHIRRRSCPLYCRRRSALAGGGRGVKFWQWGFRECPRVQVRSAQASARGPPAAGHLCRRHAK